MIMPLKATETGKISHEMSPGSIIAAGDLLASLQLAVRGKTSTTWSYSGNMRVLVVP